MTRYLITYHGPGMPHDPASIAQAREAFLVWAAKTGSPLVDPDSPIAGHRTVGAPTEGPVLGWSVIEAASPDDVVAMLADHPFVSRGNRSRSTSRRPSEGEHERSVGHRAKVPPGPASTPSDPPIRCGTVDQLSGDCREAQPRSLARRM